LSETKSRDGLPAVRRYDRRTAVKKRRPASRKIDYARRRRNAGIALIAGLLLAVLAVLYLDGQDEILRGVRIGEVEVGGMTEAEAREAVERHASATFEEIRFGDGVSTLPGATLGVQIDAGSATEEAFALGRQGWFGQRFLDLLRAYLGGIQVDPEVEYREQAARDAVKALAGEFYEKPQNATFRLADDGQEVEVQEAREGRVLDQEATLANLDGALADLRNEVPLAEGSSPKPEVTTEDVEKLKPTEVIGEYKTDFRWDSNPSRKANMKLAAGAVNNTLVPPGEVFSFNELASDLDYEEAKTFSDGGVAYADGGGLCQVSSTLYMAAQYAGLEIVERNPHYAVLPYIKPGFDATVWFGDEYGYGVQDMKFRNTTDGYILVREWVDGQGFLNAAIHGQPTGKKVEMHTEKIFESTERGIKWATYKKVTRDGDVLFNGLIHDYVYSYNPPVEDNVPHHDTSAPRVAGWNDPGNTTGWAEVPE
jgi:vancomycin resistance protein YoaR